MLKLLSDNINTKYGSNWFESLSDEELETEPEKEKTKVTKIKNMYLKAS